MKQTIKVGVVLGLLLAAFSSWACDDRNYCNRYNPDDPQPKVIQSVDF